MALANSQFGQEQSQGLAGHGTDLVSVQNQLLWLNFPVNGVPFLVTPFLYFLNQLN